MLDLKDLRGENSCNRVYGRSKCQRAIRSGACRAVSGVCVGRSSVFDFATESIVHGIQLPGGGSIIPPLGIHIPAVASSNAMDVVG